MQGLDQKWIGKKVIWATIEANENIFTIDFLKENFKAGQSKVPQILLTEPDDKEDEKKVYFSEEDRKSIALIYQMLKNQK